MSNGIGILPINILTAAGKQKVLTKIKVLNKFADNPF
jgi:hypothetical protein